MSERDVIAGLLPAAKSWQAELRRGSWHDQGLNAAIAEAERYLAEPPFVPEVKPDPTSGKPE